MKLRSLRKLSVSGALAAAMVVSGAAHAQIEEIIVTAQKRAQSIQDVPMSITAFSGDQLEQRGLFDAQELARNVPNFDLPSSNTSRNVSVRIRGIGSSGTNPGIESSVGVFLDGLYMPTGAMSFGELTDIASYEILRGPQGTLYGRNTPIGALNVTTRSVSHDTESRITVGTGEYNEGWANGYLGGGLGDRTAARFSFWYRDRGGYEHNLFTNSDVNDYNTFGMRGKLLYQPGDAVDVNFIVGYSESERHCCVAEQIDPEGPFGIATAAFLAAQDAAGYPFENYNDSDHIVDADDEGDDDTATFNVSAQIDWQMANDFLFTSISGYQNWINDTFITVDSLKNPAGSSQQIMENDVLSQEFRIVSPVGEQIEYLAGVYLYQQKTTYNVETILDVGANRLFGVPTPPCENPCIIQPGDTARTAFDQETKSIAVYGNLTAHLTDRWDITAGLRLSRDEKDVNIVHSIDPGTGFVIAALIFPPNDIGDLSLSDDSVTWSTNTRFHVNDDVMLFATASTGYKSGGFNGRSGLKVGQPVEFGSEDSLTYEGGIKSTLIDQKLRLNATVFHTTIGDFQESSLSESGTGFLVGNAGEQVVKGLESELVWTPNEAWSFDAALAVLNSEYTDFADAQCSVGQVPDDPIAKTCDRSGETPAFAPELQWTAGVDYVKPIGSGDLEWRARVDYSWVDSQNLIRVTSDPFGAQDSYGLLNIRTGISSVPGGWSVEAFVKNAADEAYFVQAARLPLAGGISGGGFAGVSGGVGWYGPPRTWGVQVTLRH